MLKSHNRRTDPSQGCALKEAVAYTEDMWRDDTLRADLRSAFVKGAMALDALGSVGGPTLQLGIELGL